MIKGIMLLYFALLLPLNTSALEVTDTTFVDDFTDGINTNYYNVENGSMQIVNDRLVVTPDNGKTAILTINFDLPAPPFGSENPMASEMFKVLLTPFTSGFMSTDELEIIAFGPNENMVEKYTFSIEDSTVAIYYGDGNSGIAKLEESSYFMPGNEIEVSAKRNCRYVPPLGYKSDRSYYGIGIKRDSDGNPIPAIGCRRNFGIAVISDSNNVSPHVTKVSIASSIEFELNVFEAKTGLYDINDETPPIINIVNPGFIEAVSPQNILLKNAENKDIFDVNLHYSAYVGNLSANIAKLTSSEMEIEIPSGLSGHQDIELKWRTIEGKDTIRNSVFLFESLYYYDDEEVPVHFLKLPLVNGEEDVIYEDTLPYDGGNGKITFTIFDGSLPPGLTLDRNSGIITGKPTSEGVYAFYANVSDDTYSETAIAFIEIIGQGNKKISTLKNKPINESSFLIYPNPTTDIIGIELIDYNESKYYTLHVYSADGKKQLEVINLMSHNTKISTEALQVGMYFVVLKKNGRIQDTLKLVKR